MRNIVFILILFPFVLFGQKKEPQLHFYYPNGKIYKGKARTIGELNKEFGFKTYDFLPKTKGVTDVMFIKYTAIPLYVLAFDTIRFGTIDKAINEFDLNKYINSYDFKYDLTEEIKNKSFTSIDETIYFGKPENYSVSFKNGKKIEIYDLPNYHIKLFFTNGILSKIILNN